LGKTHAFLKTSKNSFTNMFRAENHLFCFFQLDPMSKVQLSQ
jgi:hypothetical protein